MAVPVGSSVLKRDTKEFRVRSSYLSTLLKADRHLQTIKTFIYCSILVLVTVLVADYYRHPEKFHHEWNLIGWNCEDVGHFFIIWLIIHAGIFFIHFPLVCWNNYRQYRRWTTVIGDRNGDDDKDPDQLYDRHRDRIQNGGTLYTLIFNGIFLVTSLASCLGFCSYWLITRNVKIIVSMFIAIESIRLYMKSHAFFVSKRNLQFVGDEFQQLVHSIRDPVANPVRFTSISTRPQLLSLLYYLFAPTLIYRDRYPRTVSIRWPMVFGWTAQLFLNYYLLYLSFVRLLIGRLTETGHQSFPYHDPYVMMDMFFLSPVAISWLTFYGFFHLWCNIFAELLRFADRHYYEDFWNAQTLAEFYRKWNQVVQDWLYVYVYIPTFNRTENRPVSWLATMILSFFGHEFIIAMTMHCYIPAFLFVFAIIGSIFYLVTARWPSFRFCRYIYMLGFFLFLGSVLVIMTLEYYSRINCPIQHENDPINGFIDFFIPRFIYCVKF